MPLSRAQLEQFQRDGYTTAPAFFSAEEVRAMRAELDRLVASGKLRNVKMAGDGKTADAASQNLQICPIAPESDLFKALPFDEKVVEAVSALIGDPVIFHLDQIFLKPGRTGVGTNWHQDNAYFKIPDPTRGVGLWTALHPATVANGTMHVVPGSHTGALPHERDPNSDHHICCTVDEAQAVPVELPAGGVLFFNYGVAHCTKTNTTDTERAGLALHFLQADMHLQANGGYAKALRPVLTGPDATGGEREYGERQTGRWKARVAQQQTA